MTIENEFRELPTWLAPRWLAEIELFDIRVKSTFEPLGQNPVTDEFNAGLSDRFDAVVTTIPLEFYDMDRLIAWTAEVGKMGKVALQDPLFKAPGSDGFRDAMSNGLVNGASFDGFYVDGDGYPGGKLILRQGQFFNIGQDYLRAATDVTSTNGEENLFIRTQEFENAAWSKPGGATVSADTSETADPFGGALADKITAAAAASGGILRQSYAAHGHNTAHVNGVHAKKGNHPYLGFRLMDKTGTNNGNLYTFFDFNKRTWTKQEAVSAIVTHQVEMANGWWRLGITGTTPGAHVDDLVEIALVDSSGDAVAAPAGTEYLYLYGAQLQVGSAPTPYIETTSVPVTSSGEVKIPFWPRLKNTPADNATIDTNDAFFHGQLLTVPKRGVLKGTLARPISLAFRGIV